MIADMRLPTADEVTEHLAKISDPVKRWEKVQTLAAQREVLAHARQDIVTELMDQGYSLRETASILDVSPSRVHALRREAQARR